MNKFIVFSLVSVMLVLSITLLTSIGGINNSDSSTAQAYQPALLKQIQEVLQMVLAKVLVIQEQLARLKASEGLVITSPTPNTSVAASVAPGASGSPGVPSVSNNVTNLPELILYYQQILTDTIIKERDLAFGSITVSDTSDFTMSHNNCVGGKIKFSFKSNISMTGIDVLYGSEYLGTIVGEGIVAPQGTMITLPQNDTKSCTYPLALVLSDMRDPMPANPNLRISIEPVEFTGPGGKTYPLYSTSKVSFDTIYLGR